MRKIRLTNSANREKLMRMFNVSSRAVDFALSGERQSDLSKRIRIAAIQLEPIEDTYELDANTTVMSWEDGAVQLRYRRNEDDAQIFVNGEPQDEPRVVNCSEYNQMRKQCERIAINM